jgi:hypothetical protein
MDYLLHVVLTRVIVTALASRGLIGYLILGSLSHGASSGFEPVVTGLQERISQKQAFLATGIKDC